MKNVFKKGLVVLLASLFVTSVFAAEEATTTEAAAKPAATAVAPEAHADHAKVMHKVHCKKHAVKKVCHEGKNGKMHCKKVKVCKHHVLKHVVAKPEAAKK